jgi:hypothetical protein
MPLFCPNGYSAHKPDANAQTHPASPARAIRFALSTAQPQPTVIFRRNPAITRLHGKKSLMRSHFVSLNAVLGMTK